MLCLRKQEFCLNKIRLKKEHGSFSVLLWIFMSYFDSQRPEAPHGSTKPLLDTGSPISCESTVPLNSFNSVANIYVSTAGARPVVYELIRKKSGLFDIICVQSLISG